MNLICQRSALADLKNLSEVRRQSVILSGPTGCGKSYVALQYGNMLNCKDSVSINPTVNEIRDALSSFYTLENDIVAVIENLDEGLPAASYALLKFLEEPLPNVYVVVTCRNLKGIPDTIVSRSAVVEVCPPTDTDIQNYASSIDVDKYKNVSKFSVWKVTRSLSDVDMLFNLTNDKLGYFDFIRSKLTSHEPVSTLSWLLGHYQDNTECPADLVIRYIMCTYNNLYIRKVCLECLKDLRYSRIASSSVLAKIAFELKYGGY